MKIKTVNVYVTQVIEPDPSSPPTLDPDNKINFLQDNTEVIARLNEQIEAKDRQIDDLHEANQVLQDRIRTTEQDREYDKAQLKNARNLANNRGHDLQIVKQELTNLQKRYKQLGDANSATSQRNAGWMRKNGEKAVRIAEAKALIQEVQDRYREKHDPSQGDEIVTRLNNALDALAGKTEEGTPDGD